MTVRLEWEGKPERVERVHLPFQTVETINESRATRERDRGALFGSDAAGDDRNVLIWGDNKLVMSSLLSEYAGKVKLVYIDPPFATGADFSARVRIGDADVVKQPSILEEHAYRDTWGAGYESYLSMMYERLVLLHELLAADGTLYVHCDWHVNSYLRLILDEVLGSDHFLNEVIWRRATAHNMRAKGFVRTHETLLVYRKGEQYAFREEVEPYSAEQLSRYREDADGRLYKAENLTFSSANASRQFEWRGTRPPAHRSWGASLDQLEAWWAEGRILTRRDGSPRMDGLKVYLDETRGGSPVTTIWTDLARIGNTSAERVDYATQKPESLLERVISTSSNPGDLVGDFFCGSGTTAVVAERLQRRWLACDLGRFAIHTTRKRLLSIADCRPFDIKNLGSYERQRWQQSTGDGALRGYLDTILAFYRAEPLEGFLHLHGRKDGRIVHVGATDAPVTIDECEDVMDELADNGMNTCDLLGWEWEMGLHDTIEEHGRRRGIDLRLRQIPREVMERSVAETVRFFELALLELDIRRQGREVSVVLKDFAIPSDELIPDAVREKLTLWSDLIDYWSVDFDFRDDTFHNRWQAFRTRDEPTLAIETDWHEYETPGSYAVVVKAIDIFGNDTTKLAEVRVK
jgi:DNA modification methylase